MISFALLLLRLMISIGGKQILCLGRVLPFLFQLALIIVGKFIYFVYKLPGHINVDVLLVLDLIIVRKLNELILEFCLTIGLPWEN